VWQGEAIFVHPRPQKTSIFCSFHPYKPLPPPPNCIIRQQTNSHIYFNSPRHSHNNFHLRVIPEYLDTPLLVFAIPELIQLHLHTTITSIGPARIGINLPNTSSSQQPVFQHPLSHANFLSFAIRILKTLRYYSHQLPINDLRNGTAKV